MRKFENMTDFDKSIFEEIGNIGAGNAARSTNIILNECLKLDVPVIHFFEIDQISERLSGLETVSLANLTYISGDINGFVLFIIRKEHASKILQKFFNDSSFNNEGSLTELQLSALTEISSIFIGSYVSAISNFLDANIKISLPYICIDMIGAMLSSIAIDVCSRNESVTVVDNNIKSQDSDDNDFSHIVFIPETVSCSKILEKLGIH